jgi:hypothetical protein
LMNPDQDRPEAASFVALVMLLIVQRHFPTWKRVVVAGSNRSVRTAIQTTSGTMSRGSLYSFSGFWTALSYRKDSPK